MNTVRILNTEINNKKLKEIIRNYTILVISLFLMSFGIAISVKSNLGVSPISSLPYVLSLASSLSLGTVTVIYNVLLVLIQILLLRSKFPRIQILQIVITSIFGYFIDVATLFTTSIMPTTYLDQWILTVIGVFIMALGVFFEVNSHALVLPGEGVILAVRQVTGIEFGKMKSIFDTTNVVLAFSFSLLFFGGLNGVGLGTIFAGIFIGYVVRLYKKITVKILGLNPT